MNDIPVLPPVPAAIADAVVIDDHASPPVVLVDREQKTDAAVQAWVETLCRSHPEVDVTFAGRTELAAFSGNPAAAEGQSETQDKVIRLFRQACEVGASDIHLITEGNSGLIRMRVNGELYTVSEPPAREIMTMATTIYGTMCDASEPHLVETREQDARLKSTFLRQAGLFGARYSHRPKVGGLLIVMRTIPDDGDAAPTLDALGFLPEQINLIEELERRPEGVNALSGPTGSGKSTTLRCLSARFIQRTRGRRNLITIEDPPEGRIAGGIQTPVIADKSSQDDTMRAWQTGIQSSMRLDPDALLIGELRDYASSLAGISAALSGHWVLTTFHTTDPLSILTRLQIYGHPPALLADPGLFVSLISQRLAPVLCTACRIPWTEAVRQNHITEKQQAYIRNLVDVTHVHFRNPDGCPACRKKVMGQEISHGLRGRTVIAEIVPTDRGLMETWFDKGVLAARMYWKNRGGITRCEHMRRRVAEGMIDPLMADDICPLNEDSRLYGEVADD